MCGPDALAASLAAPERKRISMSSKYTYRFRNVAYYSVYELWPHVAYLEQVLMAGNYIRDIIFPTSSKKCHIKLGVYVGL